MLVMAFSLASLWSNWLWPILLLIIGLGLVIFVHELGHFLAAKGVGIKVERFALGFGPRVLGYRGRETDYCICLLPLGGYVKMLGQEDFKPLEEGGEEPDPRSYNAKSVGARLLVISAGVVMNVIFAALLFVIVFMVGMRFVDSRVGSVEHGYPADQARIRWTDPPPRHPGETTGLKPGDRIVVAEGEGFWTRRLGGSVDRFQTVQVLAALADRGEVFDMKIERPLNGETLVGHAAVGVRGRRTERGSERFAFGIGPAYSLTFANYKGRKKDLPIQPDDRLIRLAGVDLKHAWQLNDLSEVEALLSALYRSGDGEIPAQVPAVVARDEAEVAVEVPLSLRLQYRFLLDGRWRVWDRQEIEETKDGDVVEVRLADGAEKTLPRDQAVFAGDVLLSFLGMTPRLRVQAVMDDMPAKEAGIEVGDVIVSYADEANLTYRRLLQINKTNEGEDTRVVIERDGRREEKTARPKKKGGKSLIGMIQDLDLSQAVVGAVLPGTAAETAGVVPGDRIIEIRSPGEDGGQVRPVEGWLDVFNALYAFRGREVRVRFEGGKELSADALTPELFDPSAYAVAFGLPLLEPLMGPEVRTNNPLAAVAWGAGETGHFIMMTYGTLRSWLKGTISHKEFTGPVGIGGVAIQLGRKSVIELVYFMAIISVSLAVVNFLPLPVVDGGHAVFLFIEKIRGKPVPTKIVNVVQMVGLALLLFVFVWLTWNDIARLAG